jgi:hypothetical protein
VPPVFQPERAAKAIFRAAHGGWREYWLGTSTVEAILANTLLPGLLDRYLAHNGYEAQETPEPVAVDRRDNLVDTVSGLHRTRGSFGAEARNITIDLPGPIMRIGAVALACAISAAIGFLAGRTNSALAAGLHRGSERPRRILQRRRPSASETSPVRRRTSSQPG